MKVPRILLVDDDKVILDALHTLLSHHGYETVSCQDGGRALEVLLREPFDLVILDIGLPSPDPKKVSQFDGVKVLQWLRRLHQEVPVLVFTSSSDPSIARQALDLGAKGVLVKGTPVEDFIVAIKRSIATKLEAEPRPSQHDSTAVVFKDTGDGLQE